MKTPEEHRPAVVSASCLVPLTLVLPHLQHWSALQASSIKKCIGAGRASALTAWSALQAGSDKMSIGCRKSQCAQCCACQVGMTVHSLGQTKILGTGNNTSSEVTISSVVKEVPHSDAAKQKCGQQSGGTMR